MKLKHDQFYKLILAELVELATQLRLLEEERERLEEKLRKIQENEKKKTDCDAIEKQLKEAEAKAVELKTRFEQAIEAAKPIVERNEAAVDAAQAELYEVLSKQIGKQVPIPGGTIIVWILEFLNVIDTNDELLEKARSKMEEIEPFKQDAEAATGEVERIEGTLETAKEKVKQLKEDLENCKKNKKHQ